MWENYQYRSPRWLDVSRFAPLSWTGMGLNGFDFKSICSNSLGDVVPFCYVEGMKLRIQSSLCMEKYIVNVSEIIPFTFRKTNTFSLVKMVWSLECGNTKSFCGLVFIVRQLHTLSSPLPTKRRLSYAFRFLAYMFTKVWAAFEHL